LTAYDGLIMSDNNIQSVLVENRSFPPPDGFARNAYPDAAELARLHEHAARDPEGFWAEQARSALVWHKPFTRTLDASAAPNYRWFTDGELNVSSTASTCTWPNGNIDRDHVRGRGRRLAPAQLRPSCTPRSAGSPTR
jgi:hypothetical protein